MIRLLSIQPELWLTTLFKGMQAPFSKDPVEPSPNKKVKQDPKS
jgi:hypothetical protein